jgi:MFS family permease
MVVLGIATMLYNVIAVTVRQRRTPNPLVGRVSSVFNVLGVGSLPLAALAAGMLAKAYGTRPTIAISAAPCLLTTFAILLFVPHHDPSVQHPECSK